MFNLHYCLIYCYETWYWPSALKDQGGFYWSNIISTLCEFQIELCNFSQSDSCGKLVHNTNYKSHQVLQILFEEFVDTVFGKR
jgi:hypothetical protein